MDMLCGTVLTNISQSNKGEVIIANQFASFLKGQSYGNYWEIKKYISHGP